jgi:hypothetical protein
VADFRRDITAGKWTSYLQFAAGVMFCVPAGLISKDDIPNGCGLMVRNETGWRTVKGPTMRPVDNLPRDAWIKLLLDGMHRISAERIARGINEWELEARVREKFGHTMADLVRARRNAENQFERDTALLKDAAEDAHKLYPEQMTKARERVEKDIAEISAERREMAVALGLPETAAVRLIINRAWEVRQRLDRDNEIRRLKNALDAVQSSLSHALEPIHLPGVVA